MHKRSLKWIGPDGLPGAFKEEKVHPIALMIARAALN